MPDFAKLLVEAVFSRTSGYDPPTHEFNKPKTLYESTPDFVIHGEVNCATAGGTTLDLSMFTTIDYIAILNRGPTNYVTVTHRSAGNGSNDNIDRVAVNKFYVLTDVTPANDITLAANSAAVQCEVWIAGS